MDFAHNQNLLNRKQAEYRQLLENRSLADWRQEIAVLSGQKTLATRAIEAMQSLAASKQISAELENTPVRCWPEKHSLRSNSEPRKKCWAHLSGKSACSKHRRCCSKNQPP